MPRSKENESSNATTRNRVGFASWMSSFGIFYLMILALISVPLVVVTVVLFIRTMFAYRIWILAGLGCLVLLAVFFIIRRRQRIAGRFDREKEDLMEVIRAAAREGHNVNVSFLHGLIRLDYEGRAENDGRLLSAPPRSDVKALPLEATDTLDEAGNSDAGPLSVADELEKLHDLMERGIVSETEFQELKEQLLKDSRIRNSGLR